jgi:hypothetical protein
MPLTRRAKQPANGPERPTDGQHRQVSVKLNPRQPTHTKGGEPVPMFQRSELSFDCRTAPVQVAPPFRLTRDERVQPRRLAPDRLRLTLTGRAAPLRGLPLEVGTRERPAAVLALGGKMLATLDGGSLAEGEDRHRAVVGAGVIRPLS